MARVPRNRTADAPRRRRRRRGRRGPVQGKLLSRTTSSSLLPLRKTRQGTKVGGWRKPPERALSSDANDPFGRTAPKIVLAKDISLSLSLLLLPQVSRKGGGGGGLFPPTVVPSGARLAFVPEAPSLLFLAATVMQGGREEGGKKKSRPRKVLVVGMSILPALGHTTIPMSEAWGLSKVCSSSTLLET